MVEASQDDQGIKVDALSGPLFVTTLRPQSYINCDSNDVDWQSID